MNPNAIGLTDVYRSESLSMPQNLPRTGSYMRCGVWYMLKRSNQKLPALNLYLLACGSSIRYSSPLSVA
ncbi:hypothetical protein [Cyclobacterium xiamenense]|uniref:hypothetical protein n=1 Tax=Cyclobacterium xiamenense TaxID=1297121 RepID=UPI0035CE970A